VDKTALMGLQIDPYPEPSRLLISLLYPFLMHRPLRRSGKMFVANFTECGIRIMGREFPVNFEPDNAPVFDAVMRTAHNWLDIDASADFTYSHGTE
jgi:hypothetical protein